MDDLLLLDVMYMYTFVASFLHKFIVITGSKNLASANVNTKKKGKQNH